MDRTIINTCRVPKGTPVNAGDRKPAVETAGYHCPMPTASCGAMAIGNGGTASCGATAIGNGGTASCGAMGIDNGGTASCGAMAIGNGGTASYDAMETAIGNDGAAQPRRGMTMVASHFNGWWVAANRGCNAQPRRGMTTVASHFNGWWVAAGAGKRAFRYATTTMRTYRVPKGTPVNADDRIPAVEMAGYHCPMPNGIMRRNGNRQRRRECGLLTVRRPFGGDGRATADDKK